ncbi:hypothetical protein SRABI128_02298 [Microbacterium sp. Bi128]|nr:hypothetical protein SRABI128_02298 [Microbacterium sp. Bi128]
MATEKTGRATIALTPTPIAATTPTSSTRMPRDEAMTAGFSEPANVATTRNGSATTRNASPEIHAARNLPRTISVVVTSVTCTGARVAASRSPLTALPLRVGETSSTSSSTNMMTIE